MAKNKLYEEMYDWYKQGYSLQQVGEMFGMSRQSVYTGFKRRKYLLREKKELPFVTFNSEKFTIRNNGYYGKTYGNRELMHRYVWRFYKGDIPKGYDIHHKDRNKTNNKIENLEIYEKSEHARKFNTGRNQFTK